MKAFLTLAFLMPALSGCTNQAAQPQVTYQTYSYSCCQNGETTQVWHPGEQRTIAWTAVPGAMTSDPRPAKVTIRSRLSGPFASVAELKNASANPNSNTARRKIDGTPLQIDNRTVNGVVSVVQLPADLPAGFYNLDLVTDYGNGNSSRSSSVIVVN